MLGHIATAPPHLRRASTPRAWATSDQSFDPPPLITGGGRSDSFRPNRWATRHDRFDFGARPKAGDRGGDVPLVRSRLERALTWSKRERREPLLVHDVVSPPLTVP